MIRSARPKPSKVYDVLWRFAAERQRVYLKRTKGEPAPWTADPVLAQYRFTNAYRASDRVSQYLIRMIYDEPSPDLETLFLRTMLFKIFNKIETWEAIVAALGLPEAATFDFDRCDSVLTALKAKRVSIYSAAYIMPSGGKVGFPKHRMHLGLLRDLLRNGTPSRLSSTASLAQVYDELIEVPTFGPFLAFQYAIDLNYTPLLDHGECEYVVAGPGALDGLSKCFESLGDLTPADTIKWLADIQEQEFERLGLQFHGLWGRPLQPIDVQNLFCEVSKYTRVTHPDVPGPSGRTRIKQKFMQHGRLQRPFFPPKWGLDGRIEAEFGADAAVTSASSADSLRESIRWPTREVGHDTVAHG